MITFEQWLNEDRKKNLEYLALNSKNKEAKVLSDISKVVVKLTDRESSTATRLAEKFKKLKDDIKTIQIQLDEISEYVRYDLAEEYFDALDMIYTLELRTLKFILQIEAPQEAGEKITVDKDAIIEHMLKLAPQLIERMDEIKKLHTIIEARKPSKRAVNVRLVDKAKPVKESVIEFTKNLIDKIINWFKNFKNWALSYDKELDEIKEKYNLVD